MRDMKAIELCLGLYERVEIRYVVDHYEARLTTRDDNVVAVCESGESVEEAFNALCHRLSILVEMYGCESAMVIRSTKSNAKCAHCEKR